MHHHDQQRQDYLGSDHHLLGDDDRQGLGYRFRNTALGFLILGVCILLAILYGLFGRSH